ncbi:MAG: XrtA/PEP-CTERM system exopolysaccharide export protein [Rhodospirillaceae bacterium]
MHLNRCPVLRAMAACVAGVITLGVLSACATTNAPDAPTTLPAAMASNGSDDAYVIGPTDQLNIFVWRQPELSTNAIVRPDGRISVPLIDDLQAAGQTPTQLASAITTELREYIQDPKVSVIVTNFVGPFDRQIRVVGEAAKPQAIPFRRNMTVLDVMIQVGGLTEFASGNRAVLVRSSAGGNKENFRLRLNDLLKEGDVAANAYVLPGDVIIIPQSYF